MFYQDGVQSGITTALQGGKAVVCFVTDNGEESQLWETAWLRDLNLPQKLESRAITLRIEKDSQEARQLSSFYSIDEAPALLVINQGRLDAHLRPGISKNDFVLRLLKGLHPALGRQHDSQIPPLQLQPVSTQIPTARATIQGSPSPLTAPATTQLNSESTVVQAADSNQHSQEHLPSQTTSSVSAKVSQQETYAQRQARQKRDANQERERVRALIEADKRDRKARDEIRRKEAHEAAEQEQRKIHAVPTQLKSEQRAQSAQQGCSLQIRLLDGSTTRQNFTASDTIGLAVRKWIDENRTDDPIPYTLKLVLTPQPSRSLDDSDEKHTLNELGLLPSATMALVPVKTFTEAYRTSASQGIIRGAPILVYGYLTSLLAIIAAFLRRVAGTKGGDAPQMPLAPTPSQSGEPDPRAVKSKIRVTTLHNQSDGSRDDQQLYNGNTLNFEPKRNDDEAG